jgi:hypothetical protein
MNFLISELELFAITKNEKIFNKSVDILLDVTNSLEEIGSDDEWDILKKNYSNIKYINELMNHYDYNLNQNFFKLLSNFLDIFDKNTQIYLKNINWQVDTDDELKDEYDFIQLNFQKSLESSDCNKKMLFLLKAYGTLVPIVEDFRNEKYVYEVEDRVLESFNPKRLKIK